ncbi:MAG TPA: DinB family protein [Candidatus Dormibacteraeota bacterium]|nr:DinB family protein [Candidatus Dormibacteraeota bacterium]
MASYLEELYAHQEWADAEHWRAFEAHPAAFDDKAIRERLLHIHLVQHGFLWVTAPQRPEFAFKKLEDFASMAELKKYACQGLAELNDRVKELDPASMEEIIEVPWFRPPAKISVRQALTQAAMHSHYHRGQNATRLRELGGVPPTTDFIVWLLKGQPQAQWT